MGRVNAAAATAYLGGLVPRNLVWINFGAAGHRNGAIGEGFLIHKITDRRSKKNYYPLRLPYQQTAPLACYDIARDDSAIDATLVDMESAGFFPIARLFTYHELIHLYKIVADNQNHAFKTDQIPQLVSKHLTKLSAIRDLLCAKAEDHLATGAAMEKQIAIWLEQAAERWHLSVTNRSKLAHLLRQWFILRKMPGVSDSPFNNMDGKTAPKRMNDLIAILEEDLTKCQDPRP